MAAKLPPKRQAFVTAYLGPAHGNATEAARVAGYKSPNAEGCRLLANADVSAAIGKVRKREEERADITRAELVDILAAIARGEDVEPWHETNLSGEVSASSMGPPKTADRIKATAQLCKILGYEVKKKSSAVQDMEALIERDPAAAALRLREAAERIEAAMAAKLGGGDD